MHYLLDSNSLNRMMAETMTKLQSVKSIVKKWLVGNVVLFENLLCDIPVRIK